LAKTGVARSEPARAMGVAVQDPVQQGSRHSTLDGESLKPVRDEAPARRSVQLAEPDVFSLPAAKGRQSQHRP
jgi:hypothetical protein